MDWNKVATANKTFYDQIAPYYDQIDGRRGQQKHEWIDQVLRHCRGLLCQKFSDLPLTFLDAGTGSGFLALRAQAHFEELVLVDISEAMLAQISLPNSRKIVADCASIPLPAESVHLVGAFAALHHLFSPRDFFLEAARLLKKGGLLYSDHDIEKHFVQNFEAPLQLYRKFFDHGIDYLKQCPEARAEDYHLSEFHGDDGLDGEMLRDELHSVGLRPLEITYHWQGMGLAGKMVKLLGLDGALNRPGMGPVVRIIAQKV